ncbi:MAG TPA: tetratricopeptide repeat protein, partial [Herpetosiphonaceae bacterium]
LPQVAAALHTGIAERHVLLALNQSDLATALKTEGWDGGLAPVTGDTLRIVDADVGYGAVNAFVERLSDYQVALDRDGTPLTATLTLTYTNRYSPWAEAPTAYAVNGQCTDPRTLALERRPGCYANYLRVYVPQGSQLLDAQGLEESLGVDQQHGRTIFGGYLRVQPGAERVVRLSYRLPALTPGTLTIEKQPGTLAPPIKITAGTTEHQTTIWTSAQTDRKLEIHTDGANVTIDGPQDQAAAEAFARHAAWIDGLAQWQAGDRQAALQSWQAGAALDRAIDHARTLPTGEAIALTEAIAGVEHEGRAAFEQAILQEAQGRQAAADALYRTAAERSPENPLAQLTWTRRQIQTGTANPTMRQVAQSSSAVRRWRAAADALEQTERLDEAAAYLDVLVRVMPEDRTLALRHTDLLLHIGQQDLALARYEVLAQYDDIWGRLAAARLAQTIGNPQDAIALYGEALLLATDYATAFRIGDGLRDLGAQETAMEAYDRTASLAPGSIWPLLAAGDMLRGTDPARARVWYSRAQQLDPASGYPDFALGTMLLNHGDTTGAIQSFVAATTKQPDVQLFQETLDRVQAQQRSGALPVPARVQ